MTLVALFLNEVILTIYDFSLHFEKEMKTKSGFEIKPL